MYNDKSEHRKWLIRDIKKIEKQLQEFCKDWWQTKYASPESSMAQAYDLVLMSIQNLINYYDPEFIIQDLMQQELVQRVENHFKKEGR